MSTFGWQLFVDCRGLGVDDRELLIGELWSLPILGIEERGADVIVGFESEAAARSAAAALTVPSRVVAVTDDGYLDEWRKFARPWQVEKLFVRPSWVDAAPPSGAIEIVIDPQRSFGSGAHPSTRLALALLQQLDLRTEAVLDLGCGSGVLAIAAAALGAPRVEAIDVDAHAIAATVENARRNGVDDRVVARFATIDDVSGDFGVVVANVLPSIHHLVAEGVRRVARRHVILAGMLDAQVEDVESAYRATRVAVRHDAGWTAVALQVDHRRVGS